VDGVLTDFAQLTLAIGEEIRGSTTLAQGINDDFDSTSAKLKGTMTRMLRMAERTGIGWRIWAGFFAAVTFLFWYVWLF
jgi:blocked early in transport 1